MPPSLPVGPPYRQAFQRVAARLKGKAYTCVEFFVSLHAWLASYRPRPTCGARTSGDVCVFPKEKYAFQSLVI